MGGGRNGKAKPGQARQGKAAVLLLQGAAAAQRGMPCATAGAPTRVHGGVHSSGGVRAWLRLAKSASPPRSGASASSRYSPGLIERPPASRRSWKSRSSQTNAGLKSAWPRAAAALEMVDPPGIGVQGQSL